MVDPEVISVVIFVLVVVRLVRLNVIVEPETRSGIFQQLRDGDLVWEKAGQDVSSDKRSSARDSDGSGSHRYIWLT